ncbi:MAG: hypothetical protein D6711_04455 [Chloroflexi bacterium]|nr:MAG: hypothetical protein D6711_04455 [Chloroflexota bacterium]
MCVGGMITAVTFTNKTRSKAGCKEEKSRLPLTSHLKIHSFICPIGQAKQISTIDPRYSDNFILAVVVGCLHITLLLGVNQIYL